MREIYAPLFINLYDFNLKLIAFMHNVLDLSDAMARELGDVAKPLLARQDFNESAEVHDARDPALVDSADFHIAHDVLDDRVREDLFGGCAGLSEELFGDWAFNAEVEAFALADRSEARDPEPGQR